MIPFPLSKLNRSLLILLAALSLSPAANLEFEKSFPANGKADIVVPLQKWGRFSFQVENPQGSSIELIDKKVGTRNKSGVVGSENGRIDEYLDKGEYKLKVNSSKKGTGTASLKVFSYTELNRDNPQYITPLKQYSGTLKDCEQVSYWLHVEKKQTVYLEALGRNVDDIQIWRSGQWREKCNKSPISAHPYVETPLKGFRVVESLDSGYYQITVYGGKGLEWSDSADLHPFYLKMDEPIVSAAGMGNYVLGDKGYFQLAVPSTMKRAILSTPEKKDLRFEVYKKSNSSPSFGRSDLDSIHAKSREPRCIVNTYPSNSGYFLLKVSGEPGTPFSVQTFEAPIRSISVDTSDEYWLSTLHSGFPQDQIGISGALTAWRQSSVMEAQFDTVSSKKSINRRFNLLQEISLFVWVEKKGKYQFIPGSDMTIRVERHFLDTANHHLGSFSGKKTLPLLKGLHKVSLSPGVKGVTTFTMRKSSIGGVMSDLGAKMGIGGEPLYDTVRPVLQFPSVRLSSSSSYHLIQNNISPEISTTVLRKLPLNPVDPLTLYMNELDTVSVHIKLQEKCKLEAIWSDGSFCKANINDKPMSLLPYYEAGTYMVKIPGEKRGFVSLKAIPYKQLPEAEPDLFPTGTESPLPIFETLVPEKQLYLDMKRKDSRIFEFDVTEPGIYEFSTSGRLRTLLRLRDRFTLQLDLKSENGVGRNAQMLSYLLPGRYQAVVETRGRSTGKMGLKLALLEKIDGGELTTEQEKRHKVPGGRAISYGVLIEDGGSYTVESQGQRGYFEVRFDDSEGWPIVTPGASGKFTQNLDAGNYSLISLPQQQDRLRIARLTRTEDRISYEGKGEHELRLNRGASSVWNEELSADSTRKPAIFNLTMSAPAECRLTLTEQFTGSVSDVSGKELFSWSGSLDTLLPMGDLQISVITDKEQNHLEYQLSVKTNLLIPGLSKSVRTGSTLDISLGASSVVELFSQGMLDVSARLYDSTGTKEIDFSDDGTNDWNFKISRLLNPGRYKMKIEGRGGSGRTKVLMRSLVDTLHTNLKLNETHAIDMAGKINSVEFTETNASRVFQAEILGESNVGALLERFDSGSWKEIGRHSGSKIRLAVPVLNQKKYRLSFWSTDHLNEEVKIRLGSYETQNVTLAQMKKGMRSVVHSGETAGYLWYEVDLGNDSLGHFNITAKNGTALQRVVSTPSLDTIFLAEEQDRLVSSLNRKIWIGLQIDGVSTETVKISQYSLDEPIRFRLGDEPRAFVLSTKAGYLTLFSGEMKIGTPLSGTPARESSLFYPGGIGIMPGSMDYSNKTLCVLTENDDNRVIVWNGDHVKGVSAPTPMLLSQKLIPLKAEKALTYGVSSVKISRGRAVSLPAQFDNGAFVGIALAPHSAALWKRADGTSVLKKSGDEVQYVTFNERAGQLFLINNGTSTKRMEIECREVPANYDLKESLVTSDGSYEGKFHVPGRISLSLDRTNLEMLKSKIFLTGAIDRVDWVRSDGLIVRNIESGYSPDSSSMEASAVPGGFLVIHHGKGWVKVDVSENNKAAALWSESVQTGTVKTLNKPQVLALKEDISWYSINLEKEMHLRLKSTESLVGVLMNSGEAVKTYVGVDGSNFDIPLSKGNYSLGLRSIGSKDISGVTVDASLYPIRELNDTLPLSMTFAPGQSRLLTFSLDKESQIGIGVQTNREVVLVQLLNADRTIINSGQQQYLKLPKGDYFLQLSVPESSASAECTVKLFGQNPPSDEPPANLVRKFRQYAE